MKIKTLLKFPSLTVAVIVLLTPIAVMAQSVLQGYKTDETLQRGMLVTLTSDDQNKVEAITDETLTSLKGVVADPNDSPVTLRSEDQQVFVATSGSYEVLVSDENGKIAKGDLISGSSLAGVGAKATEQQAVILGRAITTFEGGGDNVAKTTLNNGKVVQFGRIQVDVGVGKNPFAKEPEQKNTLGFLQNIASDVADKPVHPTRIYLSLLVLFVTTFISGMLMFSGTRNSIVSIGRNPLSKRSILKGMFQVSLLSLIIFLTGIFGVYLLIKL